MNRTPANITPDPQAPARSRTQVPVPAELDQARQVAREQTGKVRQFLGEHRATLLWSVLAAFAAMTLFDPRVWLGAVLFLCLVPLAQLVASQMGATFGPSEQMLGTGLGRFLAVVMDRAGWVVAALVLLFVGGTVWRARVVLPLADWVRVTLG